jgi:hypothetical protein
MGVDTTRISVHRSRGIEGGAGRAKGNGVKYETHAARLNDGVFLAGAPQRRRKTWAQTIEEQD